MSVIETIFSIGFLASICSVLYVALRGLPDRLPLPNLDLPEAPASDREAFTKRAEAAMIENKRISAELNKVIEDFNKASRK